MSASPSSHRASMTRRSLRSLSGTPSKSCIVLGAAAAGDLAPIGIHKDAVHVPQNFAQCTMLNCPDIRLQSCQRSCLAKSKEVLDLRRFSKIIIVCAITKCALRETHCQVVSGSASIDDRRGRPARKVGVQRGSAVNAHPA